MTTSAFTKINTFRTLLKLNSYRNVIKVSFTTSKLFNNEVSDGPHKRRNPNEEDITKLYPDDGEQFRYLLRNSSFINLGNPENKAVKGKVFQVVGDDLYVDFGWKFYCVCQRPAKNAHLFVRGSIVIVKIKELELSTKFLGAEKDLTLLEADGTILGLLHSPAKSET